jgi:hypothetical protein
MANGHAILERKEKRHEGCGFEEVRRETIHYPSLKTVLMVENTIEEEGEFKNKRQLWLSLPKKIMYQTFLAILDYLEFSHKILIDSDGSITWIWNPKLIDRVLRSGANPL